MKNTESRNVRAELIRAGISQGEIADSLGITISSVCDVIHFRRSTPRIRLAICEAIAEKTDRKAEEVLADLFPESKPPEEVAA